MSRRIRTWQGPSAPGFVYKVFDCPGCGHVHYLAVVTPPDAKSADGKTHPCWEWNGSDERPTFKPSYLEWYDGPVGPQWRCHSTITDGRIQFLGDCSHALAEKTVNLTELPDDTDSGTVVES